MTNPGDVGPFSEDNEPAWQIPPQRPIFHGSSGWQPVRPRSGSSPWVIAIIIGGVLAVLAFGAIFVFFIRAMGEAHDQFQFDDATVRERAIEVCTALFIATDALADDPIAQASDRVTAENNALKDLIHNFGELGEQRMKADKPALTWLEDWSRLELARASYAAALADDPLAPRPAMPLTVDGYPISRRLSLLQSGCGVPVSILDDFDITPFRDLEECTYANRIEVCATPDGKVYIDGLTPLSDARVWIRFGDAVSQATRTADSIGRIDLTGVRLGNGTVVVVDATVAGIRDVVMAA